MSRVDRVLDALGDGLLELQRRSTWMRRWYVPVTAAGLTAIAVVAVFAMEATVPNFDPQYMRVLVERSMRFGGSYYSNGVHNKGPLEPIVYEVAGRLGGADGWWFVIACFVLVAAVCVGVSAAVVAVRAGAPVVLAVCVAVVAVVHLTLSDADYAGVLYARNITTTLVSVALGVAAYGPAWVSERRRRIAVVVVAVAIGLAVQTLLTACFTAAPVLLWAMWERRGDRVWGGRTPPILVGVAALAFVSAPLYYLVAGPWRDFVDGYWTYARFMSTGTGRSLSSQLSLGWDRFLDYHRERPELVVLLSTFLAVTGLRLRRLSTRDLLLHLVVAVWWLGAWVELVLSQRYSSHYFSVLAVPTIMILAVLVGDVSHWLRPLFAGRPSLALLPLVVAVVTIDVGGSGGFDRGVETAATVHDTATFADRREVGIDGRTRVIRATLDLVSDRGDPLLMWTSYPWPYLDLERTSATRYIWKTFLLGEIYLGERGPEYVLPGTWEHFADDLEEADPTAYLVDNVNPIDPSTPFREVVDEGYTDVLVDETGTLGLRDDLAAWLRTPAGGGTPLPDLDPDTTFTASPDGCVRLDGALAVGVDGPLAVELTGAGGEDAGIVVVPDDGGLVVETTAFGRAGWTRRIPADDVVPVSLVVGERSAVLVVDGEVAGAVELEPGTPVDVVSGGAALAERGATLSSPPPITGC